MPVRCFLPPEEWPTGSEVRVSGREAHHLARVLRVRRGDTVICFDGQGRQMEAAVRDLSSSHLILEAGPPQQIPPSPWAVHLGIAIPGQGKLEEIVSSATQLGVSGILPLETERTVVRFTADRFKRKMEHLRQVSVETAKQCGIGFLPEIRPVTPWRKLLASFPEYHRVLLASVEGPHEDWKKALSSLPVSSSVKILLLVGPEGDFSPEEIQQACQAGARLVSLGPLVLRCETAVVASLSILNFLLC
ncbi:MAG: RsmE family RNA methyltransferase [Candidatus Omnitrophota bacterium]|nr:RsmE family RNA methyltransferase [Candidatus Omnitrophota bacterium]